MPGNEPKVRYRILDRGVYLRQQDVVNEGNCSRAQGHHLRPPCVLHLLTGAHLSSGTAHLSSPKSSRCSPVRLELEGPEMLDDHA